MAALGAAAERLPGVCLPRPTGPNLVPVLPWEDDEEPRIELKLAAAAWNWTNRAPVYDDHRPLFLPRLRSKKSNVSGNVLAPDLQRCSAHRSCGTEETSCSPRRRRPLCSITETHVGLNLEPPPAPCICRTTLGCRDHQDYRHAHL